MIDDKNKKIDELLKLRQDALRNFAISSTGLNEMGIKIVNQDGTVDLPPAYEPYLENYNKSSLEFEWEVIYKDGSILKQFQGEAQHHFGHIDIANLKTISYISNFNWPTDNIDKRINVSLDMEAGLFTIMNGWASQEVKTHALMNPIEGNRKLILFARKRQSSNAGSVDEKYKNYFVGEGESFNYNRFVIGYEVSGVGMKALIICPNGEINIFEK